MARNDADRRLKHNAAETRKQLRCDGGRGSTPRRRGEAQKDPL